MKTLNNLSSKAVCRVVGAGMDAALAPFPPVLRVEVTNACNARCIICPHKEMRRTIERMDDELYNRVIDEAGAAGCKEVHLHNFGEPLLDKQLEDRIRYAKQRGIGKVKIFSNGSLVTEQRARSLIEAGLDELKVSFDGATREEFEKIRFPLKFDVVVRNLRRLVEVRNELGSSMRVNVACCSTTDKDATMQELEEIVDGFSFGKVHNWASEDFTAPARGIRKPCSRLWRTFTVLASGDVALCCLDYDGQQLLGRLDRDTSVRDVWNGEAYRRIRGLHKQARQDEIPLCRGCTKSYL